VTKRPTVWTSIFALGLVASTPAMAQSPAVLVKDISPGPAQASPSALAALVVVGNQAFFAADDGFLGRELWATDGTRQGTRLVADLCPGRCGGEPQAFTPSGDLMFFVAGNTTSGDNSFWLWRTDGSDDGTYPLADLAIDVFGSAGPIGYLAPIPGGAVFLVRDGGRDGYDLWRSDGTRAGTRRLFELPGTFGFPTPFNRPHPHLERVGKEIVHFDWQGALWVTDGTERGTHPVAELPITLCSEGGWLQLGERLIYAGQDEAKGCEPWVTDGTLEGTHPLRDLRPGDGSSFPSGFVSTRNGVYFTAVDKYGRTRLWKTDGTTEGTIQVRTPRPERPLNQAWIFGVVGSRVYFVADDGAHGLELWKTDGNPATTQLVADLTPGPGGSDFLFGLAAGDGFYFFANVAGVPDVLWHTRGTAASTVRIAGTPKFVGAVAFRDKLLLALEPGEGASVLALNDGTTDGTRILFQGEQAPSSFPTDFVATPRGLLFTADDDVHGGEVWRSDGRRSGTQLLADLSTDSFGLLFRPRLFADRDGVFISILDFPFNHSVFHSDGGPEAPQLLLHDPELASPDGFVETGAGTTFFLDRRGSGGSSTLELWGSDGTPSGTGPLAVVDDQPTDFFHRLFVTPGPEPGHAHFLFQNVGSSIERTSPLFATDGTAEGTRALASLGIENDTQVLGLLANASRSFLVLYEEGEVSASKLWVTDGTTGGTSELFRIDNPFDHSFISEIVTAGSLLYFTGDEPSGGREVWATDGTSEGTARVADIAPGDAGSSPSDLFAFRNLLFFGADDGAHGRELWVTDGTAAGTRQIEIRPGPRGSYPQGFAAIGDRVVFAADDGVHGLEMWVSDGTKAGTRLVADVMPGRLGSCPVGFTLFGAHLFFSAGRPSVGYELFRVPASVLDQP
jgi:ELWxxDGT repeat protein